MKIHCITEFQCLPEPTGERDKLLAAAFRAETGEELELSNGPGFAAKVATWLGQFSDNIELVCRPEDWAFLNAACMFSIRHDLDDRAVRPVPIRSKQWERLHAPAPWEV